MLRRRERNASQWHLLAVGSALPRSMMSCTTIDNRDALS